MTVGNDAARAPRRRASTRHAPAGEHAAVVRERERVREARGERDDARAGLLERAAAERERVRHALRVHLEEALVVPVAAPSAVAGAVPIVSGECRCRVRCHGVVVATASSDERCVANERRREPLFNRTSHGGRERRARESAL